MMLWKRRSPAAEPPDHRIRVLVREVRERPASMASAAAQTESEWPDVMEILTELRTVARRGNELNVARKLGSEFTRHLTDFYAIPGELQPTIVEALLLSARREVELNVAGAIQACEYGLEHSRGYLPLLERVARLKMQEGDSSGAGLWYTVLLQEVLDRGQPALGIEVCYRLLETEIESMDVLERCARVLQACGDLPLAANCWSRRAARLAESGDTHAALNELDKALEIEPENAHVMYEFAELWERLGNTERAVRSFEQCAALAVDDPDTFARVMLKRATFERPESQSVGRLMDLLEARPLARASALQRCAAAVDLHPYIPHLRFIQGVLLAQDGKLELALEALRIAIDRYTATADTPAELEVRLAYQELDPYDQENHRRIAAIHFERGEVKDAMQALAGLARVKRKGA